jgi:hypothetical protein
MIAKGSSSLRVRPWKLLALPCLLTVTSVFPTAAHAGRIIVNNALGCGTNYACTDLTGLKFRGAIHSKYNNGRSPKPISSGMTVLHFVNMSGVNWNKLTLIETGMPAALVNCSSNLFDCTVIAYGQNGAKIILSATGTLNGIGAGKSFEIGCNGPCPPQLRISGVANAPSTSASEPSGLIILAAGLAAVIFLRKVMSHRVSLG